MNASVSESPNSEARSIIIIGAGIAGLSAGCYGQMSGYRTQIFELHDKPGGLCTAWKRKGYTFDGCIEWLWGSKEGTGLNAIWRELGAAQGQEVADLRVGAVVHGPVGLQPEEQAREHGLAVDEVPRGQDQADPAQEHHTADQPARPATGRRFSDPGPRAGYPRGSAAPDTRRLPVRRPDPRRPSERHPRAFQAGLLASYSASRATGRPARRPAGGIRNGR